MTGLVEYLSRHDASAWIDATDMAASRGNPIDQDATRIWFAFYRDRVPDIETSHTFLYSHRFWPQIKSAIVNVDRRDGWKDAEDASLGELVYLVAAAASRTARVDEDRLLGLAAIGLKTLTQVGPEAFIASPGRVCLSPRTEVRTATQVRARRAEFGSASTSLLQRLGIGGRQRHWKVWLDENDPTATVARQQGAPLASITSECVDGGCSSCWVGIVSGAESLSPLNEIERNRDARTYLRLACQASVSGPCILVLPPWTPVDRFRP